MKDRKNKRTETTAVQSMKDFNKAMGLMESIAEAGTAEYLSESVSEISEDNIATGNKANWAELTRVESASLNESFEPRFAQTPETLDNDDKVAVAASMKKYLAESSEDVINLNRLPGMSVVIANETGLAPVAVEDYIDSLINESPASRDSQQKAYDMSGRVDGAAESTKDTIPEAGEFPGTEEEGMVGIAEPTEPMPGSPMEPMNDLPEVLPVEPEALPVEDLGNDDLGLGDLDNELAELDAELSNEIDADGDLENDMPLDLEIEPEADIEVTDPEEVEALVDPELEEGELDDIPELEDEVIEDEVIEDEDESFMESVASKRSELAEIKAKFESSELVAKFESIAPVYKERAAKKSESEVTAKLESIAKKINDKTGKKKTTRELAEERLAKASKKAEKFTGGSDDEQLAAKTEAEDGKKKKTIRELAEERLAKASKKAEKFTDEKDEKDDEKLAANTNAKLESIRDNLAKAAKLESIRASLLESVESKKKNLDNSAKLESVNDSRKSAISAGLAQIEAQLESIEPRTERKLTREQKIDNLKSKFESITQKEYEAIKSREEKRNK